MSSDSPGKAKLMATDAVFREFKYMCFPYEEGIGDLVPPNVFSSYNDRVLYTHMFDDIIYEVGDKNIYPVVKIDFGNAKIDESYLKGNMDNIAKKTQQLIEKKYASVLHELYENATHISFRYPYGEKFHQVFVSKINNKLYNIESIVHAGSSFRLPLPKSSYNQYFASIIYPSGIPMELNTISTNDLNEFDEKLINELMGIADFKNACIILFSVK